MTVYLVGAGPGDPGLLTLRGAEVLRSADVVVYDRLSASALLDMAPETAELVFVGKDPEGPSVAQDAINETIVEYGRQGLKVVRLKGGDPFVFARGAEEAIALAAAGVAYEVVPGITSAVAVPAYAGIPVTMRYSSTSVTIVTGHEDPNKVKAQVNWEALAQVGGTIVILMGVAHISEIVARLMAGGLEPRTPAAAIRWGTRPDQTVIHSTLGELPGEALRSPSTIVVGEVAAQSLDWFTSRPLLGRRVAVTRAVEQAGELAGRLRSLGAEVLEVPAIAIDDPEDGGVALGNAVARVREFEWVVFTSPNAARRFCELIRDGRDLAGVKLAAVGPGTSQVLAEHRLQVDLQPERFVAEALLEVFPAPYSTSTATRATGQPSVLMPRAAVARDVLPNGLRERGWRVEIVEAYRTVAQTLDDAQRSAVATADAVTFASSSAVRNFVTSVGPESTPPVVAVIGPITAQAARDCGLTVSAEADPHTIAGLLDAVVVGLREAGSSTHS